MTKLSNLTEQEQRDYELLQKATAGVSKIARDALEKLSRLQGELGEARRDRNHCEEQNLEWANCAEG